MKKVSALLLILFCSIATPLVSANPIGGPNYEASRLLAFGSIAMVFSIVALFDLMIYLIRKKKLLSRLSLRHNSKL
jgi:hypothetical protein